MINHDDYHREMLRAMEKCQFIEETMKLCILSAINIAKLTTSKYFTLKYEIKDINKLPMGALTQKFSRIHQDKDLLTDLKSITKDRNFVAHQSLLFTLGELSNTDSTKEALKKLKEIGDKATNIHERLLDVRYELVRKNQFAIRDAISNDHELYKPSASTD